MFFFQGVTPMDKMGSAAPNHASAFTIDDQALVTGTKTMTTLTTDYLEQAEHTKQKK